LLEWGTFCGYMNTECSTSKPRTQKKPAVPSIFRENRGPTYLVTVVVALDCGVPLPSGLPLVMVAVLVILVPGCAVTWTVIVAAIGVSNVIEGAVQVTVLLE
jgi:hypothetical protein